MPNSLNFTIPSRIHLTLISMGTPKYRINGGIGFSINDHDLIIETSKYHVTEILDYRSDGLSELEKRKFCTLIDTQRHEHNLISGLNIKIIKGPSCHSGFGTGTSTALCLIEALHLLNDSKIDDTEIISASNRGGTSGIGINTYFSGGYIFDLGRKHDGRKTSPSSYQKEFNSLPLVLTHMPMPDWGMALCIPKNLKGCSGEAEKDFFNKTYPLSDNDVNETLSHCLLGCTAAIKENDYQTFCKSITKIQGCAWKKNERLIYSEALNHINYILDTYSDCSAMSSLGPGIVFFSKDIEHSINKINSHLNTTCAIFRVSANNTGRYIRAI